MRVLLAPLLILLCCASSLRGSRTESLYVTRCGLVSEFPNEELQRAETRIIARFKQVPEWRDVDLCAAIFGWEIKLHPIKRSDAIICQQGNAWVAPKHFGLPRNACLLGWTERKKHIVWVGDARWSENSLAHELVHVIDFTTYPTVRSHGHCFFDQRGIREALRNLTGEDDKSGTWSRQDEVEGRGIEGQDQHPPTCGDYQTDYYSESR